MLPYRNMDPSIRLLKHWPHPQKMMAQRRSQIKGKRKALNLRCVLNKYHGLAPVLLRILRLPQNPGSRKSHFRTTSGPFRDHLINEQYCAVPCSISMLALFGNLFSKLQVHWITYIITRRMQLFSKTCVSLRRICASSIIDGNNSQ